MTDDQAAIPGRNAEQAGPVGAAGDAAHGLDGETHDSVAHHGATVTPDHDAHGHGDAVLGPIDWTAWAAGAAGTVIALIVAWCFAIAVAARPGA